MTNSAFAFIIKNEGGNRQLMAYNTEGYSPVGDILNDEDYNKGLNDLAVLMGYAPTLLESLGWNNVVQADIDAVGAGGLLAMYVCTDGDGFESADALQTYLKDFFARMSVALQNFTAQQQELVDTEEAAMLARLKDTVLANSTAKPTLLTPEVIDAEVVA